MTDEGDGFRIEKIIFESRPRHYVTANLYLPLNRPAGRTAAVLFLSGHHNTAKVVPEYQIVCQTLARAGLIVLSQDPVGQGERLSYFEPATKTNPVGIGTRDHDYAGVPARLLGDTLGRYMLHDAMRGIDYLISRPEVDPAKIGVTGNSGGGTQTSLVMMVDPRVAAAAPATFIMSREAYQRTGQPHYTIRVELSRDLNEQERQWAAVSDATVRLSFGLEDSEDQIADLKQALDAMQ